MTSGESVQMITQQIDDFFVEHPHLKEAVEIFGMTNEEYQMALTSLNQKASITSSNTFGEHGNVATNI